MGFLVDAANEQTEWADSLLRQIDALRTENTAKYHKIETLTAEVEQLKRELKAERQKQFKASSEDHDGTAPDVPPDAAPKKRGAPVGHPGWFRPTATRIDCMILVVPGIAVGKPTPARTKTAKRLGFATNRSIWKA